MRSNRALDGEAVGRLVQQLWSAVGLDGELAFSGRTGGREIMKYTVHYESKPGMREVYRGTKTVEADDKKESIDKAYRLIRRDFPDRPRSDWHFSVN